MTAKTQPDRQPPLTRNERWFIAILFVVALVIRLGYLLDVRGNPFFENPRLDALFHDVWAQSIAAGNIRGDAVFFRAPLYPYFLALVYKLFGHSYLIIRIVQHVLGAVVVVLVYLCCRRMFGRPAALFASLLVCFYAVVIYFEGELLIESFLTFLCTVWLLSFLRARERETSPSWFLSGIVYGFVCITRPTFLAAIIPLLACTTVAGRKEWRRTLLLAATFLLGMSLPIIPVAVRNYIVGGDPVLIASQGGINFYIGNNERADGYSSAIPGAEGTAWESTSQAAYVEQALGHKPLPSEESWFWYKKGFEFFLRHPAAAFALLVKKAYLFWNRIEIPNNQSFYSFSRYSLLLRALPVGFWLVGSLAIVGMFLSWSNPEGRAATLFLLFYFLVTIAFFVCDRFRLPVVPLLCCFAANTLAVLWQNVRARRWRWVWRNSPLLAAAALFVNSSFYSITFENTPHDALRLGMIALGQGEYRTALTYCEQASMADPNLPNVHLLRGVVEWMLENREGAKREFLNELRRNPLSYGALVNLSRVYAEERKPDSALVFALKAIERRPRVPFGYVAAATGFQLQQDTGAADSVLQAGRRMCGRDFAEGTYMLARLRVQKGEIRNAKDLYNTLLNDLARIPQPTYELEFGLADESRFGETRSALQSRAANGLGEVFVAEQQLDSGLVWFTAATRFDSTNAEAWSNLGIALMHRRRYADAEAALLRAVRSNELEPLYWYNLGTLYGNAGRLEEARKAFERALTLRPDFAPAKEKLALTRTLMNNHR